VAALVLVPASVATAATPARGNASLTISYPATGTLFPPESVAPTVVWSDGSAQANRWNVVVRDDRGAEVVTASVEAPRWRPSEDDWKRIKACSVGRDAEIVVTGVDQANPGKTLSSARVRVR